MAALTMGLQALTKVGAIWKKKLSAPVEQVIGGIKDIILLKQTNRGNNQHTAIWLGPMNTHAANGR